MGSYIASHWLTFAAIFYLLGLMTPLIVLRALTRDRDDGCILNLALLTILVLLVFLVIMTLTSG